MTIGCVLVLYKPNLNLLGKVLDSTKKQVNHIFISDNSPSYPLTSLITESESLTYRKMPYNVGIAAAQNVGIKYFLAKGFTHVLFLDQDSIMGQNLMEHLLTGLAHLENKNIPIGGIGPRSFNRQNGQDYRGKIKKGKPLTNDLTEVTEIISSASLIPLKHFTEVGLLDESLFIDGVDSEWCWRAKDRKGLRFFIAEKARLSHSLGEGDRRFLLCNVVIPTPFRIYYQYRNWLILCKKRYVPFYWKCSNGFKFFLKLFYFPLFVKPRKEYLKRIVKGIKNGLFQN
jgi:rhamnosyltransferase